MSRAGAIFTVYFVLFGGLVILTLFVATALVSGISDFIANGADAPGRPAVDPSRPGSTGSTASGSFASISWPRRIRSSTTSARTPLSCHSRCSHSR